MGRAPAGWPASGLNAGQDLSVGTRLAGVWIATRTTSQRPPRWTGRSCMPLRARRQHPYGR